MFKKSLYAGLGGALLIGLSSTAFAGNDSSWRAEFGIGAQGGDPEISIAGVTDDLETDTGLALSAGLWFDGLVGDKNLSLGLQYKRHQDSDFSEGVNFVVLGVTLGATLDIEPTLDIFLVNAAYRDNKGAFGDPKFHPYIGAGIGFAKSEADISAALTVNGTVVASAAASDDDTNIAGQVFIGADYDFTDSIYGGVNVSYFATDATLFGADVEFRNLGAMAVIGVKF